MRARPMMASLLTSLVVACGDLPTELPTGAALHATELGLRADVAPYSRAALFEEAIERVGRDEGIPSLLRQTAVLREHARAAQSALARGDTARQQREEQAHRRALVSFTAHALGDARIDDIRFEVRAAVHAARARVAAAAAGGREMRRAAALVEEAEAELDAATATPAGILASAMGAADALSRADQLLLAVSRLPALDELFATAVSELRHNAGPAAARALLAQHQTVLRAAQQAVAGDDRVRAHEALQALRAAQVHVVAERLGRDGVARYVLSVTSAQERLPTTARDRRRTVASDHLDQARAALRAGALERALDRATIAAEIVNALALERT